MGVVLTVVLCKAGKLSINRLGARAEVSEGCVFISPAGAGALLSTYLEGPVMASINAEEDLGEPWRSFRVLGEVVYNNLPTGVGHRL